MPDFREHPEGGFQYLPGGTAFSQGAVALPGYEMVRAVYPQPVPYERGLNTARDLLLGQGLPVTALCAAELRSTRPLTHDAFGEFNRGYQRTLTDLGLLVDGASPLARTNVAPVVNPPGEPSLYAFSYVRPVDTAPQEVQFVLAGQGDLAGGQVVRPGDISADGLQVKTRAVLDALATVLGKAGLSWEQCRQASLYTAHAFTANLISEILHAVGPAATHGLHWHFSRPPIEGLEVEIDVRAIAQDIYL